MPQKCLECLEFLLSIGVLAKNDKIISIKKDIMKRILLFALLIGFALNSYSQVTEFALKSFDKYKVIPADDYISFYIDIAGDSLESGTLEYSGVIEDLTEDGLILSPTQINKSGDGNGHYFSYSQSFYEESGEMISIDPRTITSMHYQSTGSGTVSAISALIAAAGYTTAMVIAPLISINYKTGAFNEDRYYKVAGISLITIGVTLPLAILTSGKTFEFKDLFNYDEYDEGWEFDYDHVEKW